MPAPLACTPLTQAHAYLCFTFGTDQQQRWGEISRTLGSQSRVAQRGQTKYPFARSSHAVTYCPRSPPTCPELPREPEGSVQAVWMPRQGCFMACALVLAQSDRAHRV